MATAKFSPMTTILLFISILASVTNAVWSPVHRLNLRQQQVDQAACAEYSRIANFSTVGSNATYRSAYLQASPEGGDPARAPLDSAMTQLPTLMFDAALNAECGNLSEIATAGAEANFTQGIVLQFRVNSAAQLGAGAMGMAALVAMVVVGMVDLM